MKTSPITLTLIDLEGRPGLTTAYLVKSPTAAMRFVRKGETVTAASSYGAINIWRDKRHRIHAAFFRMRVTQSHVTMPTLADLGRWMNVWWPVLNGNEIKTERRRAVRK